MIGEVEILHPVRHASGYVRCPCKRHGVGCLWLLLLKPNTGGDKRYENHRHKCAISNFGDIKDGECNGAGFIELSTIFAMQDDFFFETAPSDRV